MYNEFFIIKTLASYELDEIINFSLEGNVDNIRAFISDIINLKEKNNIIRANIGLAYKINDLIEYIRKMFQDEELISLCDMLFDYIIEVIKQTNDDKEYYYLSWSTSEAKKRGISDNLFSSISSAEVFEHCIKDDDILNLFVNNPTFLRAINIKYVLSTMNKIMINYPNLIDELDLRRKFRDYLENIQYNVPFKYGKYYSCTVCRFEDFVDNKVRTK